MKILWSYELKFKNLGARKYSGIADSFQFDSDPDPCRGETDPI